MKDLQYPTGEFQASSTISNARVQDLIVQLEQIPAQLQAAVLGLSSQQLQTAYRPGGWTLLEVAQHIPEAHLNFYLRSQHALIHDNPSVLVFLEESWATLCVSRPPLELSLQLSDAIHARLGHFFRTLEPEQLARTFVHPEKGVQRLDATLEFYVWHGQHHIAQITSTIERNGWRKS
jgi:uncharacterized damage-inducible protein DinB